MSDENRLTSEAPSAEDVCSTSATVMNDSQQQLGEFREVRRRHNNNNNLRQQVEELKHRLQLQEDAIRNMGIVFSTLSGLRDHGSETNRDRRNNNQTYAYQNYNNFNANFSRRGRPGH
jgi:hypothetical protein